MSDGDTYWQCEDCGETTNGPHRSKPCRCARERKAVRDRIVSVESGHTIHNFVRAKGREND